MAQLDPSASPDPGEDPRPRRKANRFRTPRRRLIADKVARWLVTAGGLAIIASILGILLFILIEVAPLAGGADVEADAAGSVRDGAPGALLTDEYRTHAATLSRDGVLRVFEVDGWSTVLEREVQADGLQSINPAPGRQLFTAATHDGRVVAVPMSWDISFVGRDRVVTPVIDEPAVFEMDLEGRPLRAFAAAVDEDGAGVAAAVLEDGSLAVVRREVEVNLFTDEVSETFERSVGAVPTSVDILVMESEGSDLYGGNRGGELLWWSLAGGEPSEPQVVEGGAPVTALTLLIGGRSLIVGREDGEISVWFQVRDQDNRVRLTRIRDYEKRDAAITLLSPSLRNKGFLAQDAAGGLGLYYSTSKRLLWSGESPVENASAMFFSPKSDGAFLAGAGRIASVAIDNPHPEISLRTMFGKVWYEGYEKPEYVWQSTGGTDDFESKLSLTPLMIGTLKGTIYSLFLAIPLGVLAAMYASQFMHPAYKRYVKPTVEIMAALPSVVLGFLAGLWLAPRIERLMPALMLMLLFVPLAVLLAGYLWHALPRGLRNRFRMGSETAIYLVAVVLAMWISMRLGPGWEAFAFGGSFEGWLLDTTGLRYDQRNAIVVGIAMGFAVIPIIFSIAEDAFSNVPRNLVAGSLALGASRWQTVTRVVLPTASPGIFSAIIIGFGRAVGETMIVLMATGNTPVLDWNPFNGFRTLSANIAVEIPEAPHGETLYRMLFLAALMLFIITFVINTFAELVRQRLRKRYSQL
jgi:phosphate transport system permease protein